MSNEKKLNEISEELEDGRDSAMDLEETQYEEGVVIKPDEIPEPETETETKQNRPVIEYDSDGVKYDDTIHTGTKTKTGRWRKKRKKGTIPPVQQSENNYSEPQVPEVDTERNKSLAIASTMFFINTGAQIFGAEFYPKSAEEEEYQIKAWENFYTAYNIPDPPPWVLLLVALGSYTAQHTKSDKAKEIKKTIGGRIKDKIQNVVVWYKTKRK